MRTHWEEMERGSMYAAFEAAIAERDSVTESYRQRFASLQTDFESAITAEYRRRVPKGRKRTWRDQIDTFPDKGKPFREPWQVKADSLARERIAAEDAAEAELVRLAADLPVPTGTKLRPILIDEIDAYRYWSQGYGACNYARAAAERVADLARFYGIPCEVHEIERHRVGGQYPRDSATYGVFVDTTPLGWQILKRKPGPGLVEVVRLCWKRGVNPRVMYPFLPHGFEEKHGLDYFGGKMLDKAVA